MYKKILITVILLLNSSVGLANNRVINTSIEEYKLNDFSIVFADSDGGRLNLNYKFSRNFLVINLPKAADFQWENDALYQKYVKYSITSQDKKTLSIRLMDNIKHHRLLHKDSAAKINLSSNPFKDERKDDNSFPVSLSQANEAKNGSNSEAVLKTASNSNKDPKLSIQGDSSLSKSSSLSSANPNKNSQDSVVTWEWAIPDSEDNAIAIFRSGEDIVIVIDKTIEESIIQKSAALKPKATIYQDNYTILKFHKDHSIIAQREQNTNNWVIKHVNSQAESQDITPINFAFNEDKKSIFFNVNDAPKVFTYVNPIMGNQIAVIPLKQENHLVKESRSFVDYIILPTIQGIAVGLNTEEIDITRSSAGVRFKSGLNDIIGQNGLSSTNMVHGLWDNDNSSTLLPFTNFSDGPHFLEQKKNLQNLIINNRTPEALANKRYELAKFYFREGLYHEALTVIDQIMLTSPNYLVNNPDAILMNAVSNALIERYQVAHDLFELVPTHYIPLDLLDEYKMWVKYNNSYLEFIAPEIPLIQGMNKYVKHYSPKVQWKLALRALEKSILHQRLENAEKILQFLKKIDYNKSLADVNDLLFLEAKFLQKKQQFTKAENIWHAMRHNIRDPRNRMRATTELVRMQQYFRDITISEAIEQLMSIRTSWRGDKIEYDFLLTLAEMYQRNNNLVEALRVYKYTLAAFGNINEMIDSLFLTTEMIKLFNFIFARDGISEVMSDFEVISLFYEFRELTPIGSAGDRMVIAIANRLINLDLLDKAEALLEHQVTYRLNGEQRVQTANHLALIYIMNHKPEKVLQVIKNTDRDNYIYDDYLTRLHLKAKSLSDLGEYVEAEILLADDISAKADLLREEIYFRTKNWANLIDVLEPKVIAKVAKEDIFYESEQDYVLKLALGYFFTQNIPKLKFLADNLNTENKGILSVIDFLISNENLYVNFQQLREDLKIPHDAKFLQDYKKELFLSLIHI